MFHSPCTTVAILAIVAALQIARTGNIAANVRMHTIVKIIRPSAIDAIVRRIKAVTVFTTVAIDTRNTVIAVRAIMATDATLAVSTVATIDTPVTICISVFVHLIVSQERKGPCNSEATDTG